VDEVPKVEMPSPAKALAHSSLKRQQTKGTANDRDYHTTNNTPKREQKQNHQEGQNPILIQDDNRQRATSRADNEIEQLETKLDIPADKDADLYKSRSSRLFKPYQIKGFTAVKVEFVKPPMEPPLPPPEKETQFVSRDWTGSSGLIPKARVRMTEHAVKLMEYNT